jgi:hypothetical protein
MAPPVPGLQEEALRLSETTQIILKKRLYAAFFIKSSPDA